MAVQYCNYDIKGTLAIAGATTLTGAATFGSSINMSDNQPINFGGQTIFTHTGSATRIGDNTSSNVLQISGGDATFTGSIITSSSSAVIQTPRISMEADGTLDWGGSKNVGTLTWDTSHAYLRGQSSYGVKIQVNSSTNALTFDTSANATFAGDLLIPEYIYHSGDTNTYIRFTADTQTFRTGGDDRLTLTNTAATFAGTVFAPQASLSTTSTTASVLRLIDTGVIAYDWTFPNDATVRFGVSATSNKTLLLQNSGTGEFNLSVDNNGTFGGQVTGPTPTTTTSFTNKAYVDSAVAGAGSGTFLPLAGNTTATAMTGDIFLANQQQVRFLTSANAIGLRMQVSGTNSFIDNEVGDMYIRQEADNKDMIFQADDGSGGNATYFRLDSSLVDGTTTLGAVSFPDKSKLLFGAGDDLQIFHDGSNSFIDESGTGNLFIRSNTIQIRKYTGEDMITCLQDNAVTLYFDNSPKLATSSTGISVTGNGTFTGFVKAPYFTSDGGRSFKMDGVAFEGGYSNGSDANGANDLGSSSNQWRDLYLSNNIIADGDITLDSAGDITLDADGGSIKLKDASTTFGTFSKTGNDFHITANRQDGDMRFFGNDGGTSVNPLNFDMSEGGNATFSGQVQTGTDLIVGGGDITLVGTGRIQGIDTVSAGTDAASKAYVDNAVTGGLTFKDGFNAGSGAINGGGNLTTGGSRVAISVGDYYVVTTSGSFYGSISLDDGDSVICKQAAATGTSDINDWVVVQSDEGVSQFTSGNAITASSGQAITSQTAAVGSVTVQSFAYDGGTDVGHVPTGGSSSTFLRGDGNWATPTNSGGTVTSVATTNGITGGTITGSGTIQVDSTVVRTTGAQSIAGVKTFSNNIIVNGGINGSNYNINGVNQLSINDPGEGIVFTGTTTLFLDVIDDTSDDKLRLRNATQLDLNSTARITNLVNPTGAQDGATKSYVDTAVSGAGSGTFLPLAGGTMTGDVRFNDGVEIEVGTSRDLVINHDGSNSYIKQIGTGDLIIRQSTDDSDIIFQSDDGSGSTTEYLRLDGGAVITVVSKDFKFSDNITARFGNSDDLQIYHDGSNSYINEIGTGDLIIKGGNDILFQDAAGNTLANMNQANSVELYYGNSKKFETSAAGVLIHGSLNLNDNGHLRFGAGNDLDIYHDSSHSYIKDVGTGDLKISSNTVRIESDGAENMIIASANGSVNLYYNNNLKLQTTNTGVSVTGGVTTSGSSSFAGNISVADDINITNAGGIISFTGAGYIGAADNFYVGGASNGTDHTYIGDNGRNVTIYNGATLTLSNVANATTDTDKFLVSDSGVVKYRTGAQLLSDIGGAPATGGAYLPLAGGTMTTTAKIYFYNTSQYIHANSVNDLTIASGDDINYISNFNRFYTGGVEFARLSGNNDSWIANGTNSKLGVNKSSGINYNLDVEGTFGTTGAITIGGNATFNGAQVTFNPDADSSLRILNAGTNAIAIFAAVGDVLYLGGNNTTGMYLDQSANAVFSGNLYIPSYIYHSGDPGNDTYFGFNGNDNFSVVTAGGYGLVIDSNRNATFTGDIIFSNNNQALKVESSDNLLVQVKSGNTVMTFDSAIKTVANANFEFDAGLIDINGSTGSAGQLLSSTGTTVDWIDAPSGGGANGTTAEGTGSNANYFSKLATFTIPSSSSFADLRAAFTIIGEETSNSAYAEISVMMRKGSSSATSLDAINIAVLNNVTNGDIDSQISSDNFYLKYTSGATMAVDLYMKKNNTFGQFDIIETSSNFDDWVTTYYTNSAWISALPSTTYTIQTKVTSGTFVTGSPNMYHEYFSGGIPGFGPPPPVAPFPNWFPMAPNGPSNVVEKTSTQPNNFQNWQFQMPTDGILQQITITNITRSFTNYRFRIYDQGTAGTTYPGTEIFTGATFSASQNVMALVPVNEIMEGGRVYAMSLDLNSNASPNRFRVAMLFAN